MTTLKDKKFEHLHSQFRRELKLQGKSPKTIDSYSRSLRRLVNYFDCYPDELNQEELKLYFLDLVESRSWSTVKVDRWGLRQFWELILKKEWNWPGIVRPPKVNRLPDVLTIEEVDRLMAAFEKLRYRVCLFTIYSLGLRLSEGINLKVQDIDSARHRVHVRDAKYNKDRLVPLPEQTLYLLRKYWITHRNRELLFPAVNLSDGKKKRTHRPMDKGGVQTAMKIALRDCNIHKKASVHTLRHSYATHLMEAGVNLRLIQEYLGHASINTTTIYARLSKPSFDNSEELIRKLMKRFKFVKKKSLFIPESD
jgi:integrase/recombinase XerD